MKNNVIHVRLEKRGCNFWKDSRESKISDVGNYRVGIYDYLIPGENGRMYVVEFGNWNHYQTRTTNKRTGQPLKKPVRELVQECALHISTQFEEQRPGENYKSCWADLNLESEIYKLNLPYTMEGIKKALEVITGTEVVIDGFTN